MKSKEIHLILDAGVYYLNVPCGMKARPIRRKLNPEQAEYLKDHLPVKIEVKVQSRATKVRGYSPDELFKEHMTKPKHWPYSRNWECVVRPTKEPAKQSETSNLRRAAIVPVPHVGKVVADKDTVTPKRKVRRRNRMALERACGTRVVAALEQILAEEAAGKNSLLDAICRNGRAYNCELSLDELVTKLKKRYGEQLVYSDSTLKSALPHFVSCPRGRPGILERHPQFVPVKKDKP